MVIYIQNTLECIAQRKGFGDEAYENMDFQGKVKKVYEEQLLGEDWWTVDGMREVDVIAEEIFQGVRNMLRDKFGVDGNEVKVQELGKLFID